jgi:Protein of unknown function (DUF5818)
MTIRLRMLAISCLAAGLMPAAMAQGGGQSQPTDPTVRAPTTPAQTTPPTFPEPAPSHTPDTPSPENSDTASSTPDGSRMFAGSIEREKSDFVLKVGNTAYKLDDQSQAEQYKGKAVKVTGSLDKKTNTIHVEKIETSSSM